MMTDGEEEEGHLLLDLEVQPLDWPLAERSLVHQLTLFDVANSLCYLLVDQSLALEHW